LWAVEDCRQLTRSLERQLLAAGEELVRVPPKLMAPERRAGRTRGKPDPIDALAVARAAVREPGLSRPRPHEGPFRELKLLVDHRDDLVDERRRMQQRLRWHLYQLDPAFAVPLRMLARASHLDRVGRWLARQELQVRLAREPDRPLPLRRQLARHSGVAPLEASSGRVQRHRLDRGGNRQLNAALLPDRNHPVALPTPAPARTSNANRAKAKADAKRSAASSANSSASSSTH
jgi:transposase